MNEYYYGGGRRIIVIRMNGFEMFSKDCVKNGYFSITIIII